MDYFVTPQQFGAKADGIADDTEALRLALEEAQNKGFSVYLPAGTYRTLPLAIPDGITVKADASWSYSKPGKTIIIPADENQDCVFDLSASIGVTLYGLELDGQKMGSNMHGLAMFRERRVKNSEHSTRIDTCQIRNFSGDGIHFSAAWAVSMRHSQCCYNGGYGFYLDGCDAFIVDNWFSANGKAGFGGDTWNSAVNFTSNRIEWNRECGVRLMGSMRYNLTGNYFDRSYGPAIEIREAENFHKRLQKTHTVLPFAITITGNTIVRSGKAAEPGSDMDCHIYMHNAVGVTITGNTFNVWKDDGRNGRISPFFGIVYDSCSHCVITGNTMLAGAVEQLFVDKGGHGEGMIVENNTGAVVPPDARTCQDPFTPVHYMSEGGAPWYSDVLEGESNE